ncbi:MAG: outer membrane beta-barrel domain-containing protein [Deltaproteobacteria bacterium]|nr:outer membrane beta-barrel domain-containing protein [Deltaproteobacteria bacterium]
MLFVVGLAFTAGSALAQPKKPAPAPKTPAPKKDDGEIDMSAPDPGEIDMSQPDPGNSPPGDLEKDMAAADKKNLAVKSGPIRKTPLSWEDIVVVVRKPFLKSHRTELYPYVGTTMNDNMIRHYTVGGELAYYLSDTLAVGVEGNYYIAGFREPFDLVARQARRLPTVNQYNWSAALNFHYVPVYGKFAILDKKLITWEIAFTAGIGAGQSEVIPRDTKFPGFTNFLIMPNVGANMRFFITKWLTINAGIRDYAFIDKFEPTNRAMGINDTAQAARDNADSAFINNVMFQIGISFWVPTSFEYTTFR